MAPTLTVTLPTFGDALGGDWRRLLDLAVAAEEAGVDRVVVPEHVVLGSNIDAYPWGRFPAPPEAPWLDPVVVLSAIAGVTSQLRLGTGILVAPLRPAVVLAKAVATLDVLSGGRVDLGVGTGWQREELEAAGVSYEDRGRILTDTIAACRALWTELPASFASPSVTFTEILCARRPRCRRREAHDGGRSGVRRRRRDRREHQPADLRSRPARPLGDAPSHRRGLRRRGAVTGYRRTMADDDGDFESELELRTQAREASQNGDYAHAIALYTAAKERTTDIALMSGYDWNLAMCSARLGDVAQCQYWIEMFLLHAFDNSILMEGPEEHHSKNYAYKLYYAAMNGKQLPPPD